MMVRSHLRSWPTGMARSPSPKYQPGASSAAGRDGREGVAHVAGDLELAIGRC